MLTELTWLARCQASGFRLTKEKKKPLYVSVGHKINLTDAIEIVKLVKPKERIPEPLRLTHINSKALATSSISLRDL
jgi:deoxyinosine 3'endonuclease (endonuclease V)